MPNRFIPIPSNADQSQVAAIINKNFAELDNETVVKTFNDANGNPNLILGKLPNDLGIGYLLKNQEGVPSIGMYIDATGNPILKVAKAGYDVTTAGDSDLVFNSAQNVLKVVDSGTLTMPTSTVASGASSTRTQTYTHNLGFVPMVLAVATNNNYTLDWSGSKLWSFGVGAGSGITYYGVEHFDKLISTTSVSFTSKYLNGSGGSVNTEDYVIRYYLLQETSD